jgi:hypothetical protein
VAVTAFPGDPGSPDLALYYRAMEKPHLEAIRAAAHALDPASAPTEYGDWGPWANGGARLTVGGKSVSIRYRELEHVVQTIAECRSGRVTVDYQPGRPHGFHNHSYLAEVALADVLVDPTEMLGRMKALAEEYPPGLASGIIARHGWEAGFMLDAARQGDALFVAGAAYRVAAALVQVVFALNGAWFLDERDSLRAFKKGPKDFAKRLMSALGKKDPMKDLSGLVEEIRKSSPR